MLAATSMLPGAAVGELAMNLADPKRNAGFSEYAAAVGDLAGPAGTSAKLIGASLFGIPLRKQFVWHGRGAESGKYIRDVGGTVKHGGAEIKTPNTSFTKNPVEAMGFSHTRAGYDPARLTRYKIKEPEKVRNLPPDEYIDIASEHEIAGMNVRPSHGKSMFPTADVDPDATAALYSYPSLPPGIGYDEKEIAAARNITKEFQNEVDRMFMQDPERAKSLVRDLHDPVLGRAQVAPRVTAAADIANKEYQRTRTRLSVMAEKLPDAINPRQASEIFSDIDTMLSQDFANFEFVQNLPHFIDRLAPAGPRQAQGARALQEYVDSFNEFSEAADEYLNIAQVKAGTAHLKPDELAPKLREQISDSYRGPMKRKMRRLHGLMTLKKTMAQQEIRSLGGAVNKTRTYVPEKLSQFR
jgi:hypothetical protein